MKLILTIVVLYPKPMSVFGPAGTHAILPDLPAVGGNKGVAQVIPRDAGLGELIL